MFLRFLPIFVFFLASLVQYTVADDDPCRGSPYPCEVLKPWVSSPRQRSLQLLPGDNVTLRCDVEQHLGRNAAGAIWMAWYKDNTTASVRLGRFIYSEKNAPNFTTSYALSNVQPHDSGTFICQAKSTGNLRKGNSTGVRVMVAEPQLETPNITADTLDPESIDLGANVTLRCETQAYPHALFNWTKDGRDVSTNHSSATDHMTIRGFSQSDEGLYACVAWNVMGEKRSHQLQLKAKPSDRGLPDNMIIAIAVGAFAVVFVVVGIPIVVYLFRRRRQFKHCPLVSESDEEEADTSDAVDDITKLYKLYDACILCCREDESWAKSNLVDELEKTKQKVYLPRRDDTGGDSVFQYLSIGVAKSKNVIVVHSPSATSDKWFEKGYQTAIAENLDENLPKVIPVLRNGFKRNNLPIELKNIVPLDGDEPQFFERLQRSLSKDSAYESAGPSPAPSLESLVESIVVKEEEEVVDRISVM